MKETAEDMMRFTRKELEEQARASGLEVSDTKKYPSKMDIARAILNKQETKRVEEPRAQMPRAVTAGKKGVYAKRTAINGQVVENKEAVARIGMEVRSFQGDMADMSRHIRAGSDQMCKDIAGLKISIDTSVKGIFDNVRELQRGIKEQSGKNAKAAADMGASVKALKGEIGAKRSDMGRYRVDFKHDVGNFEADMSAFSADMNANVHKLRDDIAKFQDITANYIKDFYFG